MRAHIVVAGAGFAGLAAAFELFNSGYSVTVLEARQRVGGRVWSELLPNGARIELGAEWISSADYTLIKMAQRFNLTLVQLGVDYRIRSVINGPAVSVADQKNTNQIARDTLAWMNHEKLSSSTIGEFLDDLPVDHPQKTLLWSRLQGAFGKDLHRVALRMLGDYSLGNGGSFYRVATGNQSLATALANSLPDVRLGYEVTNISQQSGGVSIMGKAGTGGFEIKAGAVILALPISRLIRLKFNPPLPMETEEAIWSVSMGVAAKLAVGTRMAPSLRALQDVVMPYWCWTGNGRGDDQKESPRCALTAFCGSEQAQENLATKSNDPTVWYNKVREANIDLDIVGNPVMVDWSQDEWALGCYSAFDNLATNLFPFLSLPVERLFFAGEHTAVESGLMEGALTSGIRAARQIIEARIQ